jgi:hypothetical protein
VNRDQGPLRRASFIRSQHAKPESVELLNYFLFAGNHQAKVCLGSFEQTDGYFN